MSTICIERQNIGSHILEVYQNDKGIRWYAIRDGISEVMLSEDDLYRLALTYEIHREERMTEITESIGNEGNKVHVLIGCSARAYVLEDDEGTQMTLDPDEMKDIAKIVWKYEDEGGRNEA